LLVVVSIVGSFGPAAEEAGARGPNRPAVARTTTFTTDWPELGFDPQNSSSNPHETILDVSNVSQLVLKWVVPAGFVLRSPVLANGVLYTTQDTKIVALDAATGATLWTGPTSAASPAVDRGVVYVMGKTAYALDAATGDVIWSTPLGTTSVEDPTVLHGLVFTAADPTTQYDHVMALDGEDGSIVWTADTGTSVQSPAVSRGRVYAGGEFREVLAVDAATGAHEWRGRPRDVLSPTSAVGGIVYVGTEGSIFAFNGTSGEMLWFGNGGGPVNTNLVVADGQVVASADVTGRLTASDAVTGARTWVAELDGSGYLAEANGVLYVNTGFTAYAVEAATGEVLWSYDLGHAYTPSYPIVADGVLYLGSNGNFYAFSLP